jgi:hypothetical protein
MSNNNFNCTAKCKIEANENMIMCTNCKSRTHFVCTELLLYQLYLLTRTSRKYTCVQCAIVPQKFKENWDSSLRPNINFADNNSGKGNTNPDFETLVTNLEDKLTTAISNVHKASYDKDILKLKTELNDEKVKSYELHNTVTNLIQTNIELKEQCKLSVYVDSLNSKVQAIEKSHLCVKQAP